VRNIRDTAGCRQPGAGACPEPYVVQWLVTAAGFSSAARSRRLLSPGRGLAGARLSASDVHRLGVTPQRRLILFVYPRQSLSSPPPPLPPELPGPGLGEENGRGAAGVGGV
jgi:hypothetical protein